MIKRQKSDPPLLEFEVGRARWRSIDADWKALLGKRDAMRVALSLARNPPDAEGDRGDVARRIAGEYAALVRKRPDHVARDLADLDYEIQLQQVNVIREREIWDACRWREANRLAIARQPRQRAAVEKTGKALELLSIAIAEECAIREEYSRASPEAISAFLPDCSFELASVGSLADWGSGASVWARRMKGLGLIQ
jgi:hypothetical protein